MSSSYDDSAAREEQGFDALTVHAPDPGAAYPLGVDPTGPLPRGWHRVNWTDYAGRPRYMITDDIGAAALAQVALGAAETAHDVELQSWSDTENLERVRP